MVVYRSNILEHVEARPASRHATTKRETQHSGMVLRVQVWYYAFKSAGYGLTASLRVISQSAWDMQEEWLEGGSRGSAMALDFVLVISLGGGRCRFFCCRSTNVGQIGEVVLLDLEIADSNVSTRLWTRSVRLLRTFEME